MALAGERIRTRTPGVTYATTATISNLVLGDYSVTVTDASGCSTTASFTVEGVTALEDDPRQQSATDHPVTKYPIF